MSGTIDSGAGQGTTRRRIYERTGGKITVFGTRVNGAGISILIDGAPGVFRQDDAVAGANWRGTLEIGPGDHAITVVFTGAEKEIVQLIKVR
jgi:hypothetical protein